MGQEYFMVEEQNSSLVLSKSKYVSSRHKSTCKLLFCKTLPQMSKFLPKLSESSLNLQSLVGGKSGFVTRIMQ